MKTYERRERVSGQIQKVLSGLILKGLKDPALSMTTITGVDMSPDLKNARIHYVTTGGASEREKTEKGFKRALGFIKRELAKELGLRYMPKLKFYYDESFDYGSHIETILHSIKKDDGSDSSTPEE